MEAGTVVSAFGDAFIVGAGLGFGMSAAFGFSIGFGWLFWDAMRGGKR